VRRFFTPIEQNDSTEATKMKTSVICGILMLGSTALAAPAFAGPVGLPRLDASQQAATVSELQTTKVQLAEKADLQNARGPLRIAYMVKQGQIDGVISRIENGQPVSANAVDEAMQPMTAE
jgi:hypothetical protein